MALKFGTDGVRGVANAELTPELVLALGRAAARVLGGPTGAFLIGRDTRASGPLLQSALAAGLASEGLEVRDLGVLPTPGVAAVSTAYGMPAAMISASHNPFSDNGIKLFGAGGRKLTDDTEKRLEQELAAVLGESQGAPASRLGGPAVLPPTGAAVGRVVLDREAVEWYERQLVASLEGRSLRGIRVAIDCANGSATGTASDVLRQAGADVVATLFAEPDGCNINDGCGSTDPGALQAVVTSTKADVGLAFDGDADRVIAVDHNGQLVDGDHLLALFAIDMKARGRLASDTVVVTVMTNLGFRLGMQERGISVRETQVGDRYVLEALDEGGLSLGGEQSGHIIFRDLATTGDGVLTGIQLLDLVSRQGKPLAELTDEAMVRLPQVLRNVPVADRDSLASAETVWAEVAHLEAALAGRGRVLLRPSGTEPLVRIMVEAPTEAEADSTAEKLAEVVTRALG
ncbi:MAG TPA: phosphoglucosamine mutase [Acidimicrobiales bacterium]|nr:phosphoglucosamine mutase [Acidimicrobiales bacterium]